MKDFIIFYRGHQGSGALVNTLMYCKKINVPGMEPFDDWNFTNGPLKKDISLKTLLKFLSLTFSHDENAQQELDGIYSQYSDNEIPKIARNGRAIGFKMRLRRRSLISIVRFSKKNNIFAFVLVRRDHFLWAISACRGQLQFQLALDKLPDQERHNVTLDTKRFRSKLLGCYIGTLQAKVLLVTLRLFGVSSRQICYEDMCSDREAFFRKIFKDLNINLTEKEILRMLDRPLKLKKVHTRPPEEFISNFEEIRAIYLWWSRFFPFFE